MHGCLIVLSGPPLPGRFLLARALEARLGAKRFSNASPPTDEAVARGLAEIGCVLVDGDLPTAAERRRLLEGHDAAERLLVTWCCSRADAEREIFHRYAARPRCLADAELERFLVDSSVREPATHDIDAEQLILVGAGMPLADQVLAVVAAILPRDLPSPLPADPRPRVLVVEDDPEQRQLLAEVLAELGCAVEVAPDAAVALALLGEIGEIDLVITDQQMPGLSGVELAREIESLHPQVRTVLLTAHGDQEVCREATRARAVTVLSKPVHAIDLARVVEEASLN